MLDLLALGSHKVVLKTDSLFAWSEGALYYIVYGVHKNIPSLIRVKVYSVSWHMEGRQFVTSCGDGSLVTWAVTGKPVPQQSAAHNKPVSVIYPHGKKSKDTGKMEPCDPIEKVIWGVSRSNYEPYFVFRYGPTH